MPFAIELEGLDFHALFPHLFDLPLVCFQSEIFLND